MGENNSAYLHIHESIPYSVVHVICKCDLCKLVFLCYARSPFTGFLPFGVFLKAQNKDKSS